MENNKILEEMQNSGATKPQNKNNKVVKIVLTIVLSVVIACLSFVGGYFFNYLSHGRTATVTYDIVSLMEKVGYIYDPVTGEERELTEKDVANAIVNGLLDEYSAYYTAQEYQSIISMGQGNYKGIGVAFYDVEDAVVDVVMGNSPVYREGLRKGDKLIWGKVNDGEQVDFNNANDILYFIESCGEDDFIKLRYLGSSGEKTITVQKEDYVTAYVTYYDNEYIYCFEKTQEKAITGVKKVNGEVKIVDNAVAYIVLDTFEGNAVNQMREALSFMKERGKSKLILDLRNNGGGFMDTLTGIASFFIDNGGSKRSVVAYSEGKTGTEVFSTDANRFCSFISSMAVIANQNTASASECLIGALVTYKELVSGIDKIIVEKNPDGVARTYGKGIMQTTYSLMSGGAFKLTTARILWPDKKTCIHRKGITDGVTVAEIGQGLEKALATV